MNLLRDYALRFVGVPYRWGGSNPMDGYDCSGFAKELLASVGIDPPGDQTAQGLYDHFIKLGYEKIFGLGAFAFYGKSTKQISHVAMMISDWQIIEAGGGGSGTTTLKAAVERDAYVRIRTLHNRLDLVDVRMPKYQG